MTLTLFPLTKGRPWLSRFVLFFISLTGISMPQISQAQTLIAGWDFQTNTTGGTVIAVSPITQKVYQANVGSGNIYLDGSNGSSNWTNSTNTAINQLNAFTGTTVNSGLGLSTNVASPASLALVNNTANNQSLVFNVSLTGYSNLEVSYATQRTTSGFTSQQWDYSSDGLSWQPLQTITGLPTVFGLVTLNAINELNNFPNAYLRLTVNGATFSSGNNRLDNIRFMATQASPNPNDIALTSLVVPSSNSCTGDNETLETTVCNLGSNAIDLSIHPITVTYHVNTPTGLTLYTQVLNTGTLNALNGCMTSTLSQVNLYSGGSYSVYAYVSCPSLTDANPANDTSLTTIAFTNLRPNMSNYTICTDGVIPNGQGLTVTGCTGNSYQWYDVQTGGISLSSDSIFNPLVTPNAVINSSNQPGTYYLFAACSTFPSCREAAALNIRENPVPVVTTNHSCDGLTNASATVNVPRKLTILTPTPTTFDIGTAVFGPSLIDGQLTGEIASYATPDEGCTPYPAGTFAGKIALIDRGNCAFELKAYHAQMAGAIGVIIINNIPGLPPNMGPVNLYTITIPLVSVTDVDGALIRSWLNQSSIVTIQTPLPYTSVLWSNGSTTSSIQNLYTDNYSVTVVDDLGCVGTFNTHVFSSNPPQATLMASAVCPGSTNGTIKGTIDNFPNVLKVFLPDGQSQLMLMAASVFGPRILSQPINGQIYYYANPDEGCNPYPPGTFAGYVALIDRGSCTFEQKVYNAQEAGAVGVIIVNNVPDPIFTPGAANLFGITIPTIMISQADGLVLKNLLLQQPALQVQTYNYTFYWVDANAAPPQNILSFSDTLSGVGVGNYLLQVADNQIPFSPCISQNTVQVVEAQSPPTPTITPVANAVLCNNVSVLEISENSELALSLNGIDQWADLGVNTTNLNDADFTMEAWIKTTGIQQGIIVSSNNDALWEDGERAFFLDTFGRPTFVGYGNGYILCAVPVNDNVWHHVAVTWNYSLGKGHIFIDGVNQTFSSNYQANFSPNIGTFSIGRPNFLEAPNYFNGSIDEVRIWNTARTQSQIQSTMYHPISNQPNLVSYFKMNDAGGIHLREQVFGWHATTVNQPAYSFSDAFNNTYKVHYGSNIALGIYPRWAIPFADAFSGSITTPLGCSTPLSAPQVVTDYPDIIANGATTFCDSGNVTLALNPATNISRQYATQIYNYSSQYTLDLWGALQILGKPNVYPAYGDLVMAWASSSSDAQREFLELGFKYPQRINYIDIYETFSPGAIDSVFVKDDFGVWQPVYSAIASAAPPEARILHITFPGTTYTVQQVRIALNSPAVPNWNEIDAVAIGYEPVVIWNNADTALTTTVSNSGNYYATVIQQDSCIGVSNTIPVFVDSCSIALHVKLFLQGFYAGSGQLASALFNQGVSSNPFHCDSVAVSLHEPNFPYAVLETKQVMLDVNGQAQAYFLTTPPGTYYVSITHRNSIQTFLNTPIVLGPTTTMYDLTLSSGQAYGNNLIEVESGKWAMYSGDINQDLVVDAFDYVLQDPDVIAGAFGYLSTDLTGDGIVDAFDYIILDSNLISGISAITP